MTDFLSDAVAGLAGYLLYAGMHTGPWEWQHCWQVVSAGILLRAAISIEYKEPK